MLRTKKRIGGVLWVFSWPHPWIHRCYCRFCSWNNGNEECRSAVDSRWGFPVVLESGAIISTRIDSIVIENIEAAAGTPLTVQLAG